MIVGPSALPRGRLWRSPGLRASTVTGQAPRVSVVRYATSALPTGLGPVRFASKFLPRLITRDRGYFIRVDCWSPDAEAEARMRRDRPVRMCQCATCRPLRTALQIAERAAGEKRGGRRSGAVPPYSTAAERRGNAR